MRIIDAGGTPAAFYEPHPNVSAASNPKPASETQNNTSAIDQFAYPSASDLGSSQFYNIRGVAISDHRSVSFDRNSGSLEWGRKTTYSSASRDSELTVTRSASLKISPSSSNDSSTDKPKKSEGEPNVFLSKTDLSIAGVNGSAQASVLHAAFSNRYASLNVSAFGVEAGGQAKLGINHDGISAQASGDASIYLADAQAAFHAGPLQTSGDASVGAGVNSSAEIDCNPLKGDVGVKGGVGAFAGAQANETSSLDLGGASASESANVGAGVGLDAKFGMGIDQGKVGVNFDVGGYLGVGAGVDVSFSVDVPKTAESAWHTITSII